MRNLIRSLAFVAALLPAVAAAQVPNFTLPPNTVIGRASIGRGPAQAIPFSAITSQIFSAGQNTAFMGPASGGTGSATFRAITGVDLPAINLAASGGGGVTGQLPIANTCPGTTGASSSTFLRGDCIWGAPNSTILSANNSYTGDQYFGSGRPWCDVRAHGAVGNGTTDDTAAIQACITILATSFGSGIVFFPPGNYCTFTGITITGLATGDMWLLGSGVRNSSISACGHNITVLTVNEQFGRTEQLAVYGYGMQATDVVANISAPAIFMGPFASYWELKHMLIQGGSFPLDVQCNGCRINQVTAQYAYGDGSNLRAANAYIYNSGQYWFQTSLDQILPCQSGLCTSPTNPTFPTTVSSWASAHSYTSGTVVLITCGSRNFYMQASVSGTSGGSQPACKPYLNLMTDNTVTWYLVSPAPLYAMQIDDLANEVIVDSVDMTGFFSACAAMTATHSQAGPQNVRFHSVTPGGCYQQGYLINAGAHFKIEGGDVQGCIQSGCSGVLVNNGSGSTAIISGVDFHAGGSFSVSTGTGVTILNMIGNQFSIGGTAAVAFGASNDFISGIGNFCASAHSGSAGANGYFPSTTSGNPGC